MAHAKIRTNRRGKKPIRRRHQAPPSRVLSTAKKVQPSKKKKTGQVRKPRLQSPIRVILVWGILVLGIIGLGARLYKLQITEGPKLLAQARQQQITRIQPYVPRRSITDSLGNILALDRVFYTLYVHPKNFKKPHSEIAEEIAPLLPGKITPEQLIAKFKTKETGLKIAKTLPEAVATKIHLLGLDGVDLNKEYVRFYPQDDVAAEVVGYVDASRQGQAGIENSQNQILDRHTTDLSVRQTAQHSILPGFLPQGILTFDQLRLQLTLDLRLQRAASTALSDQMQKYHAQRGAVMIMDVNNGGILAMVCEPTYDPNHYTTANMELFKNWTVSDLYEPGSTFKPINVAIGLSQGAIKPDTVVYDGGSIVVDKWPIYNASKKGNGYINVAKVLQVSSNVGMVQLMQRLPKETYYEQIKKLGIGEKVGIDLPGEVESYLKDKKTFLYNSIEAATAAFGQGFSLTPIKLLQLHAAIANGGRLVTPHLVKGLVDPSGKLHWTPSFKTTPLFDPQVTRQVLEMMETVVTEGSGTAAYIPNYRIAGKTGTAQKGKPRGGYIPNAKITSFVAILPVESPRYVVLVLIDEPKGENTFGSTVSAPVAKTIVEALISLEGLPPTSNGPGLNSKETRHD